MENHGREFNWQNYIALLADFWLVELHKISQNGFSRKNINVQILKAIRRFIRNIEAASQEQELLIKTSGNSDSLREKSENEERLDVVLKAYQFDRERLGYDLKLAIESCDKIIADVEKENNEVNIEALDIERLMAFFHRIASSVPIKKS